VPPKLNFTGDFFVLALLWGGLLFFALLGYLCASDPLWDDAEINRRWILAILVICSFLTLVSGISFAAGARLRAPLEISVQLFAAVGLVRATGAVLVPTLTNSCSESTCNTAAHAKVI
jgi:hypothetical protein